MSNKPFLSLSFVSFCAVVQQGILANPNIATVIGASTIAAAFEFK